MEWNGIFSLLSRIICNRQHLWNCNKDFHSADVICIFFVISLDLLQVSSAASSVASTEIASDIVNFVWLW